MATSIFPILVAFLLLAATASARPCQTIFFFSATTTSATFHPLDPHHGNPNPDSLPRGFTLTFTAARFPILRPSTDSDSGKPSDADSRSSPFDLPLKFYSAVSSSIRDRSKDIITVVAALAAMLLGAGCGFFSAGAVYLLYAILTRRRGAGAGSDDVESGSSDDDNVAIAKKFSYSPIPSVPKEVA